MTLFHHQGFSLPRAERISSGATTGVAYISAPTAAAAAALITAKCRTSVKVASVRPVDTGDYTAGVLTQQGLVSHARSAGDAVITVCRGDDNVTRILSSNGVTVGVVGFLIGTGSRVTYSRTKP